MNRSILKKLTSLLMVLTLLTSYLPAEMMRSAYAELAAQSRAVYGDPMDWVLSAQGEARTSGEWSYYVIQPQQYAVITGHADASAQTLSVPAVLDGADVVGLAGGALADHSSLESLRLPGNVNALASDALPRGVTILGYNATYAQRFAQSAGYPFQSLSTYDFLTGVVDYADVATHAFQRISAHEMRMRELEAARLDVGSRFFLIDPANPYQVSYYRVTTISTPDASGYVTLTCSTPEIDEVLASYEGTNEKMVLDPDTLVLTEGTQLLNAAQVRSSNGHETGVIAANFSIPIDNASKIKVDLKVSSNFTTSYEGGSFQEKKLTVVETRTSDISVGYEYDFLEDSTDDPWKDEKELKLLDALAQARAAADKKNGSGKKTYSTDLGNGMFFSIGGVVSLQVKFKADFTLEGSATVSYHDVSEHTYYGSSSGVFRKESRNIDQRIDVEGKLEAKAGVTIELTGFLGPVGVLQVKAFGGLRLTLTITGSLDISGSAVPMSPNMADCLSLKLEGIVEIGIKAGLIKILDLETDWFKLSKELYSETFVLFTLLDRHQHMLPFAFIPGPSLDSYVYDLSQFKDRHHNASDCPYTGAKVTFLLPQAEDEDDRVYYESSNCELDFFINPPADPFREKEDIRFLGWYSTESFTPGTEISWPYTLKNKETTFYGKYELGHRVTFEYNNGAAAAPEAFFFPGDVFALPDVELDDPKWYACIVDERVGYPVMTPLAEVIEFSAGQVVMPDMDLRLVAMEEALIPVTFYESVDNGSATLLLTTHALAGSKLNAPLSSDPGMTDKGWVDAEGAKVSFPFTIPEDQTTSLHFIHNLSTELPEDGSGEGGTTIGGYYPGNSYDIQSGAEAFYYTEYEDYICITGYNPTRYYYDAENKRHSFTVPGYNLVLPSSINDKPVTHVSSSAFSGMSTLLTIRFPSSITNMGSSVVANCPNLGSIKMSGVDISGVPSSFASNCPNLVEVSLPSRDGFSYGSSCFAGTGLASVTIRGNVGSSAFANCKNLGKVTVTSGCTTIGSSAFSGCTALTSVTLKEGIVSVGNYAFQNCTSLKAIAFPDSVNKYGQEILKDALALEELTVGGGYAENQSYKTFYIGNGSALRKLTLNEGITAIDPRGFANFDHYHGKVCGFTKLESVSFPESLKTIGYDAFINSGITSVNIAGSLTSIDHSAFANCTKLQNVSIDASNATIKYDAFANTPSLQHMALVGIKTLEGSALRNCGMRSIELAEGLTSVGNGAFYNCKNLKAIVFPDSVTKYGQEILESALTLEELTVGGGYAENQSYKTFYIGNGSALKKLVLNEGITAIDPRGFANYDVYLNKTYGFTQLESVSFPESLNFIGYEAFINSGITSLSISGSLTSIGDNAFANCTKLQSVSIDASSATIKQYAFANTPSMLHMALVGIKTLENSALRNCGMRSIELAEGLTSVGNGAFYNCKNLKAIVFPDSVTKYGQEILEGALALEELTVGGGYAENQSYKTFYIGNGSALKKLTLNEGITAIDPRGFANYDVYLNKTYGFTQLESISFPESLKSIDYEAFINSGIASVSISGSLTSIGDNAFSNCTKLQNVSIDASGATIKQYAFADTPSLQHMSLAGIEALNASALRNCGMRSIELAEGLTSIGNSAFYNCRNLKAIVFPDSVTKYGQEILEGALALEELTVGGGYAESLSYKTFYIGNGSALKKLTLNEGITAIDSRGFANYDVYLNKTYGFAQLESVSFPESLKSIGSDAFINSGIASVNISGSLTSIGDNAFANCTKLQNVSIDASNATIKYDAFANTPSLQHMSLSGIKTLEGSALRNCGLRSIELTEGLTSVGNHTFQNCTNLKAISFPDSVTSYGQEILKGALSLEKLTVGGGYSENHSYKTFYIGSNSALKTLILREGISKIEARDYANYDCYAGRIYSFPHLTTVSLPSTLTTIGASNLRYWPSVTTLRLGENITSIGDTSSLSWMTLITDEYHEYTARYAQARGAQYFALDPDDYPVFTVSFVSSVAGVSADETVLEDGSVLVGRASVRYLSPYQTPEVSATEGYTFAGWYKDAAFTHAVPSDDVMGLSDMTLYARFVPKNAVVFALLVPAGRTMENVTDGSILGLPQGFGVYALTAQAAGQPIVLPQDPVLNGYLFAGWFHDAALSKPFTGGPASVDGLTLYGSFVPASMGGSYQQSGEGLMISDYRLLESDSEALLLPDHMGSEAVRGVADYAFDACSITSVSLPATLTFVQPHAFSGCGTLASISVAKDNAVFTSQQGVLYSKDMTILYRYPEGKPSLSFTIPSTVTTIAPYAFENCAALRSVIIPSSVTLIDEGAFSGCASLSAVKLPDSVVQLGDNAFARCQSMVSFSANSLVTIGKAALPDNAYTAVFGPLTEGPLREYCMSVPALKRNYNAYYLTIILDGKTVELAACEAGLPLPQDYAYGELSDGGYVLALYRDKALTSLWNMESDLMPAADLTLYTTSSPLFAAEEITLVTGTQTDEEGNVTDVTLTGMILTAYNGRGGDVVLPRSLNGLPVIAIGDSFLASAHGDVNSVDIGSSVIQISSTAMVTPDRYRFAGDILAEPDTYAAQWAADMGYMCSGSLYTLIFNTMGGAHAASRQATANAFVKLPTPVRSGAAFLGWYLDEALATPAALDEDGLFLMPAQSLTLYAAWEQIEDFHFPYEYRESADGVIITAYTGAAAAEVMPGEVNGIPVIAIGDNAFASSSLTSLTLPDSVLTIGSGAFSGSSLRTVTGNGVQSVGNMVFYGCTALTDVSLASVQTIGDEAFSGCTALTGLSLPETLRTIGRYAFSGCTALSAATLPDSLTSLGTCAFLNCRNLASAHIGAGLTVLGNRAFTGCTSLTAFTVSEGSSFSADGGVLFTNGGLTLACCPGGFTGTYVIPDGTADIAANAFEQCAQLTSVTFPASPVNIGASAFTGCTALTNLALGGSIAIPESLCSGCTALTSVTLGEGLTSIGAYAFMHCRKLSEIRIGAQVTHIGSMAFTDTAPGFTIIGYPNTAAQSFAISENHLFTLAEGADVDSLTLPESIIVVMGSQHVPEVVILPAEAAPTATLRWHTADESIAVMTDGILRALKRGETTLTVAAHNGVTASTRLIVTGVPAESVELPEITEELARGNTLALTAAVSPAWAEDIPLVWTSSDESVATVDESGMVTALQAGDVTIRATANSGRWGETAIHVFHAVEALDSTDAALTMHPIGDAAVHQLAITCLPADCTYPDLTFVSSDAAIAKVDETGLVTALKVGEATITVTALRTRGEAVMLEIPVTVEPFDLSGLVLPETAPLTYTGEALQPTPILELYGRPLVAGTDYLLLTDEYIHAGTYAYTVQGQGQFTGECCGEFTIAPASAALTYTGPELLELCSLAPAYTTAFPVEVAVLYAPADAPDRFTADQPSAPGAFILRLTTPGTADVLPMTLDLPITVVESYVRTLRLSCDALTLTEGQTVQPDLLLLLEEGTPAGAAIFLWESSSEAVSASDTGVLTALSEGTAEITFTRTDRVGEQLTLPVTVIPAEPLMVFSLPAALTSIEAEAFLGNDAVQQIRLPDSIQSIGSAAFADMSALRQVKLPASVTALPADLLRGTTAVLLCPRGSDAADAAAEANLPYVLID